MKQLHFTSYKSTPPMNWRGIFPLSAFCFLLSAFLLFCSSALFAQQSDTVKLNLQSPSYPDKFIMNEKGCWIETYNELDYTFFESQIFSFSHLIEGEGSTYGGGWNIWNGFTVCNSGDSTNHNSNGAWVPDYEWGCMAGGGIKTDTQGNVMLHNNGDVMTELGKNYLVGFWNNMMEPEFFHLNVHILDEPIRCLQVILDNEEEYEAVGVYVCNNPYAYYAAKYGFASSRKLDKPGDFFKLIIHGFNPDGSESGKSVEHYFAKFENGQLNQSRKWEWVDLSSLGEIGGFYCTLQSTDSSNYGPKTPVYFCMDKLQVRTKETVIHIPVTNIINVPTVAGVGEPLTLTGTVIPTNATSQSIVWSIKEDGGTNANITNGNIFNALSTGTVVITATINDGLGIGLDFKKDFIINVVDEVVTFVITATVNNTDFGTINPKGEVKVEQGGSITFFITAFDKYTVSDVLVNGNSQGIINTYTFEDVQADGTIEVFF